MTWTDDVEDVLGFSLQYPARDVRTFAVGGALSLIFGVAYLMGGAALFLDLHPAFLVGAAVVSAASFLAVLGYFVRVVRATGDGRNDPPGFSFQVVMEGVLFLLVLAPWFLGATVLAVVPAVAVLWFGGWLGPILAGLLYFGVALSFAYFLPAVAATYCVDGWRAAYSVGGIWRVSVHPSYVALTLVYHAVYTLASVVLFLSVFTVVGWAWLWFYFLALSGAFWGRTYRRIM